MEEFGWPPGASLLGDLAQDPQKRGYLIAVDPRLSVTTLRDEMKRIRGAIRAEVADRIQFAVVQGSGTRSRPAEIPSKQWKIAIRQVGQPSSSRTRLPAPRKTDEVFFAVLHRWITGGGPMTLRWLEETAGCSYRTAVAALGPAIRRFSDRSIELRSFPADAWARALALAPRSRSTIRFADTSAQPRSIESLLRHLRALNRPDVAVGGVLGAGYHDPDLDITAAPRLEFCVHAPGRDVDLSFIPDLDPAIEKTDDPRRPVRLALHFARRRDPLFSRRNDGSTWAGPVDCLLDLVDAHQETLAAQFARFLVRQGEVRTAPR